MARNRYTHAQQMHLWKRSIDQSDRLARDFQRDREQADIAVEKAQERAEAILEKARSDAQNAKARVAGQYAAEEKKLLGAPRMVYRGATVGQPSLWVSHVKAVMPETLMKDLGASRGDVHRFLRLRPGGGIGLDDLAPSVVAASRPEVVNDRDFRRWIEEMKPLIEDARVRYPVLGKLRNDEWMVHLLGSVGVLPSPHLGDAERVGTYGRYGYKLSVQGVPSLVTASIGRTGLELTFGHIAGTSAKDWNVKLDKLRAALGNSGVNAAELTVNDGPDGSVILCFNDVDPFDGLPQGTVVPYDAGRGRSYVGEAADGSEVSVIWHNNSQVLVAGIQGGGKTAAVLPVIAGLAGHAEIHIFDGNATGEWAVLKPICANYNEADEPQDIKALGDRIEELIPVARARLKRALAATGEANIWNLPVKRREALGLYPIVVVVEESPQYLSLGQTDKKIKELAERNRNLLGQAVKLFRKSAISLMLIVQKPVADELPTVVRDMAGNRLCFRLDSDAAAKTVLGDAAFTPPRPMDIPPGKLGRFVARVDARGNVLAQAPYVPISAIREALADAQPVPDQLAVSCPADTTEPVADPEDEPTESAEESSATPAMTDGELMAELRRRGLASAEPVVETEPEPVADEPAPPPAPKPRKTLKLESTPAPESDTEGW